MILKAKTIKESEKEPVINLVFAGFPIITRPI